LQKNEAEKDNSSLPCRDQKNSVAKRDLSHSYAVLILENREVYHDCRKDDGNHGEQLTQEI